MNYKVGILVAVVMFIIIVASNSSYFKTVNKFYNSISKVPRLILMVATVLSVLGLSNAVDLTSFFQHTKLDKPTMKFKLPDEDGKRLVSDTTKKYVAAKQQWKCGLCQKMLDETYEVDHVTPLYKGGTNDISNLMAVDPICHRKKTNADRLNLASDIFISDKPTTV